MKILNSDDAKKLLEKDVINCEDDYLKPENRWVWHCLYVGEAAGRIAAKLGIDEDKAKALGCVHDIGRKIDHRRHALEGYYYMQEMGYDDESLICLTHSFINNDLNLVAGGVLDEKTKMFFQQYFSEGTCTIYDNIVQMCDLFCLDTGFTTLENRLLDIYKRKGVFSNTKEHFQNAMDLKSMLESTMGCSLYSLFPEIIQKDLDSVDSHHNELLTLLVASQKNK